MDKRLVGKVAIVTGASRGIGKAISVALGAEGATVVLSGRSKELLDETKQLVVAAGGAAEVVVTELTEETSIQNLVDRTAERFGGLDILVNNAGVSHSAKLEETSTAAWDLCQQVNARGPFILCRQALPLLRKSADLAYIVNVASVVGVKGYPMQSAYTASKHAMRGMSMSLSEELKGSNIRVHVICPGGVATEMVEKMRPDIDKANLIGTDEIAELVLYLVTHKGNGLIDDIHIRRANGSPWF